MELLKVNKKKIVKTISFDNKRRKSSDEIDNNSSSGKSLDIYNDENPEITEFQLVKQNKKEKDINLNKDNNNHINNNKKERYIKLDQPYDDMFFANWDYKELKNLIRQDFFNTYCSRKRIFFILIKTIFKFLFENFEYITYFFMLLNHSINEVLLPFFIQFLYFYSGYASTHVQPNFSGKFY